MRIRSFYLIFIVSLVLSLTFTYLPVEAIEEPLINPLNDLKAYHDLEYEDSTSTTFNYKNSAGERCKISVRGARWRYEVTGIEDKDKAVKGFLNYLHKLSGKVIFQSEREIIFSVPEGRSITWWGEVRFAEDSYRVNVYKEWNLTPGNTITRKVGGDLREWMFKTSYRGSKFYTLKISLANGVFNLKRSSRKKIGDYERYVNYHKKLYGDRYQLYYLDDIPQEEGEFYWEISEYDAEEPLVISVSMEEVAELPAIKYGEEIGALKVQGAAFGRVSVEPASKVSISHPQVNDLSYQGDLSPEGEAIFWLPAGYWKVKVDPEGVEGLERCETQLVPVNKGETTILEIPLFLNNAYTGEGKLTGGLEITNALEREGQGIITFAGIDKEDQEIIPTLENTSAFEGGVKVDIEDIKPVIEVANVVLLLDSSGSMRDEMEETLKNAREFISSLPANMKIQVIDFDTAPKLLNGNSKGDVLESLAMVKADGATALYDTVLTGLDILADKDCPNLLLFTDGVDANWDDTGPGSIATKEEVLAAVEKAGIPLYTIGFGPNHDHGTLTKLADISGGSYFSAEDQTALAGVFSAIKDNLSKSYQLTYNRPEKPALADIPVISLVVDTSSSMNMSPENEGCNYRIEKVRNLLRNFILKLPEKSLAQLQNFTDASYIKQIMTNNKTELLQALGELQSEGYTDILGSVKTAVESLKEIPSRKKVMFYVTDAALDVDEEDKEIFDKLLSLIKKENINVIWIGLGMAEKTEVFAHAAELSGGEYLLTEDIDTLEEKFNEVLKTINEQTTAEQETSIRVLIADRLSGSKLVSFSRPAEGNNILYPDSVNYQTGLPLVKYDEEIRKIISSEDKPDEGLIISKRIPLNARASNQAMEVKVDEAVFLNKIRGIKVPWGRRFLVLSLELSHILPEQEVVVYPDGSSHPASWIDSGSKGKKVKKKIPYLIPDLTAHFYLNYNNKVLYPISPLSWIIEKPIIPPGENSILLNPEGVVKGACVFAIEDEPMDQASLHFYDTDYGHIDLPLVGEIKEQDLKLEELPKSTPARLSDSFSLTITGVKDVEKLQTIEAESGNLFRIIEGEFTSRVQALLDINPEERFSLRFTTPEGAFFIPLSPYTGLLPFGMSGAVTLAPGSRNRVRFVFQVPDLLAERYPGELFIELKGEDVIIPLKESSGTQEAVATGEQLEQGLLMGEGVKLRVNQLAYYDYQLVADLTLYDEADGYGTSLEDAFILVRDDYTGEVVREKSGEELSAGKGLGNFSNNSLEVEYLIKPADETENLLLGLNQDTVVFDGNSRRVLILFEVPDRGEEHSWSLQSPLFKELDAKLSQEEYSEPELLVNRQQVVEEDDDEYRERLNEAIYRAKREYELTKAATISNGTMNDRKTGIADGEEKTLKTLTLDESERKKKSVPAPSLTVAGKIQFNRLESMADLLEIMKKISWLPSADSIWEYRYAPEAVLSQGWGTENDLANMVEIAMVKMGYKPERKIVELTEKGYEKLQESARVERIDQEKLPALSYQDDRGTEHLLVFPFMKDISQLPQLVELIDIEEEDIEKSAEDALLYVSLKVRPLNRDRNTQLRDIGAILGGAEAGTTTEEIRVIDGARIALDTLSLDAVDLGYVIKGRDVGDLYTALVETAGQKIVGEKTVDTGKYQILGERIEVVLTDRELVFENDFTEGETLAGIYHTLGINLPDLKEEMVKQLEALGEKIHKSAENPDEISTLRWYTRTVIGRFLTGQSRYEKELADRLGLTIGRSEKSRCLLVTVKAKSNEVTSPAINTDYTVSIDLLRVDNDIHNGSDDERAAFNIFSGIYLSRLESEILPGNHRGLFEIWRELPPDTGLVLITYQNRDEIVEYLEEHNFKASMVKNIKDSNNIILIPEKPAVIGDKEHWAWLEIDEENYYWTISVLETGEHGGMVEYTLGDWQKGARDFMIGAFMGIDASLWAVSSFALELESYDEIKARAAEFARGLAERFGASFASAEYEKDGNKVSGGIGIGIGGTPEAGVSSGPLKIGFGKKIKVTENMLGFSNGFKAGVAAYFGL